MTQRISTIEPDEKQRAAASGIEFSPDGNHLLVTNAGINTVIIYDVDKETGVITTLFHCKTSGDYPKAVAVMPDNKHFIVFPARPLDSSPYSVVKKAGKREKNVCLCSVSALCVFPCGMCILVSSY